MNEHTSPTIAIVGGTGKEGRGLAYRWLRAGYRIVIGSRATDKASAAAAELRRLADASVDVQGLPNLEAARAAETVVLTVPYAAHRETLESIKSAVGGKLLIDATVPLTIGKPSVARDRALGSAGEETRDILGPDTAVAAAFHHVSYDLLLGDSDIDCDVLVTGTSKQARERALVLVQAAGLQGWDAGAIENSGVCEGLTSILIHINRQYGSKHAGIRITGVTRP
jgi:NADPH-dependent F420 reductase